MNTWNQTIQEAAQGRPVKSHSGKVQPGDIFVALPGTRDHGTRYIPEALDRGAAYVILAQGSGQEELDERLIQHPHPRWALGELAKAYYGTERLNLKIIAITGTNGKTTTSYMLEHLLSKNGFKTGVIGTVNYRWPGTQLEGNTTTPDCLELHDMLARMDREGVETVCLEASSHALDQDRLAGIDVNVAIFTNLSREHLDYHPDMQAYFNAKKKLFTSNRPETLLGSVINTDDPYGRDLAGIALKPLTYGLHQAHNPALRGELLHNTAQGLDLQCTYRDRTWRLSSHLAGVHNAQNLLAAQGAGICLGLDPEQLLCLEEMQTVPGRLEKVGNSQGLHIFVDYAHSPDALDNACRALKNLDFERLVVLFGCGGDRDRSKRPDMGRTVSEYAQEIILTSDNPRSEDPDQIIRDILPGVDQHSRVHVQPDRREAIKLGIALLGPKDALLVAGKGHETYQEIQGVRQKFSDVWEIQRALQEYFPEEAGGAYREVNTP